MREFEQTNVEKINYAILVAPEMLYPVSYVIKQNGERQFVPTVLKGKDLTENQIKELIEKKIVHVGYVPMSTYTTLQTELAQVRKEREWVSVADRLPEIGQTVLTFPHYKVLPFGGFDECIDDFWQWDSVREEAKQPKPYPTHWMPLPAAPDNLK